MINVISTNKKAIDEATIPKIDTALQKLFDWLSDLDLISIIIEQTNTPITDVQAQRPLIIVIGIKTELKTIMLLVEVLIIIKTIARINETNISPEKTMFDIKRFFFIYIYIYITLMIIFQD